MHDIRSFLSTLFNNPGTLLYIGARIDAHSWLDELIKVNHRIIILEIWQQNLNELEMAYKGIYSIYPDEYRRIRLVGGDVRDLYFYPGIYTEHPDGFDYIFWWHGPEHLKHDEIEPTLTKLESRCNRLIALACPWGVYPQGVYKGNPYETHQCSLYPEFFLSLGYMVRLHGKTDEPGSEIVAWKVLNV